MCNDKPVKKPSQGDLYSLTINILKVPWIIDWTKTSVSHSLYSILIWGYGMASKTALENLREKKKSRSEFKNSK